MSRTTLFTGITFLFLGGKYYTHINGVNSPNAIMLYGEMLKELGVPVEIATTQAHVPSFMVGKQHLLASTNYCLGSRRNGSSTR